MVKLNNNKGLTMIETILAVLVLSFMLVIFKNLNTVLNRAVNINKTSRQVGIIAKNKIEEIKSGYIYIDNNKYNILDLGETINFKEENYNVDVFVSSLPNYENINRIGLKVSNESGNISYNLIRYINFNNVITDD